MKETLAELVRDTYAMFLPPKRQTVSEWADENRKLSSESSAESGQWRTDRAPYQREVMDSFTQPGIWKIVLKSSSQVGKSEIELNMIGRVIDVDPGPILYIQPTDSTAQDYSKRRVAPMIQACPTLRRKVSEAKGRDSANTILMKSFPGGSLALTGANSPSELASKPIRYLFMDETDRFPKSAGTEGDPISLAMRRTETFRHNRKIVMTSSPTDRGSSPIEEHYLSGTQEEWHTQCPHCQQYTFIKFDQIKFEKEQRGEKSWKVWNVRWECPICKSEHSEYETKRFPAKWVTHNPGALDDGIRSFWINAFMSPWSSWREICTEFLLSKGDPEKLKVFKNTMLGELWETHETNGVEEKLFARREHYNAEIPDGVIVLTAGIDTQDNRLEYEVVGWDRSEQSWGVSRGVIPGRPDAQGVWDEVDLLLSREWKMKNGNGIRIMATFIDSGGDFTQEVYKQCARRSQRKIWAIKGEPGEGKDYVRLMQKASNKDMVAFMIGVDSGKEAIMYNAGEVNEPGPGYMHFPLDAQKGYDEAYFKGLISERRELRQRGGRGVMYWVKTRVRNEPLDCRNYARAAYKYFDWDFDRLEKVMYGPNEPQMITRREAEKKKPRRVISKGISI